MSQNFASKIPKGTFLIIIIGIASFFADFTYESANSMFPQFFTHIGGSAFILGIVLGVSQFVGYAFRLVSGRLVDKTKAYWSVIFIGYAINLFAVPLLALSGNYFMAAILIFMEYFGKGIRVPPRDYVVSVAASSGKMGRAFAIQEGLDQAGAVAGPLSVAVILLYSVESYRVAFALLGIPAVITLAVLVNAYLYYNKAKIKPINTYDQEFLSSRQFLTYSSAIAVSAAGLYPLAFVQVYSYLSISQYLVPIIFAVAMAGEGIFGVIFGLLYDKVGRNLVFLGLVIPLFIPFLLLRDELGLFLVAGLFYGAATGIQDTSMRAVVGSMIQVENRVYSFGIFNAFYGFGLLVSDVVVGYLFHSIHVIIAYVITVQIIAFVLLAISFRRKEREVSS